MTSKHLTQLNNGAYTRHDVHANTFSAIDLTFTNPALSIRCNWTVHDNLMGSDHYPIVTEIEHKFTFYHYAHVPKWKLDKADWHQFRTILKHKGITIDDEADLDQCNEIIIEAILDASNEIIPKTKQKNKKAKSVPRWDKNCSNAVFNKVKAYRKYRRYRTAYHYLQFKKLRSETRDLIDQPKKKNGMILYQH